MMRTDADARFPSESRQAVVIVKVLKVTVNQEVVGSSPTAPVDVKRCHTLFCIRLSQTMAELCFVVMRHECQPGV